MIGVYGEPGIQDVKSVYRRGLLDLLAHFFSSQWKWLVAPEQFDVGPTTGTPKDDRNYRCTQTLRPGCSGGRGRHRPCNARSSWGHGSATRFHTRPGARNLHGTWSQRTMATFSCLEAGNSARIIQAQQFPASSILRNRLGCALTRLPQCSLWIRRSGEYGCECGACPRSMGRWIKLGTGHQSLEVGGDESFAAPLPLTSLAADVAALNRSLDRTEGPVVLAGHAYAVRSVTGN